MSHWTGRVSILGSGTQTIILTGCSFLPTHLEVRVNGVNARIQLSDGYYDGTRQNYSSLFQDASGSQSDGSNSKCISLRDRVGGSIQEVLGASCTGFALPGTDATVTFNVTKFTAITTIALKVGD